MKKLLGWAAIAFLIFFVVSNPTGAANSAKSLIGGLGNVGTAFGSFLAALTQ